MKIEKTTLGTKHQKMQDMRRKIDMYYSAGITNHAQECLKYSIHTCCVYEEKYSWSERLQVRGIRHFVCCTNKNC